MNEPWILPNEIGERIKTPGADWGPKGITLEYHEGDMLVAKWHGHTTWAGLGCQEYSATYWIVAKIIGEDRDRIQVDQLCQIRTGSNTKKTFEAAVHVCKCPEFAGHWKDVCECGESRGEHVFRKGRYECPQVRVFTKRKKK